MVRCVVARIYEQSGHASENGDTGSAGAWCDNPDIGATPGSTHPVSGFVNGLVYTAAAGLVAGMALVV